MSGLIALEFGEADGATLASRISAQLREAIMRGELRPGEKLHVDRLRKRFAVSLSPVREALSRLGAAGLVEIEDQRGYRVASVSDANFVEVMRLRIELESLALRESLAKGGDALRQRIAAALTDISKCLRTPGEANDNEAWERMHRAFHLALLSECGMPMLLEFVTQLHDLSDRYRRLFLETHAHDRDVPEEHRRICEAMLSDEPELACALLRQHIQRTGNNVRAAIVGR